MFSTKMSSTNAEKIGAVLAFSVFPEPIERRKHCQKLSADACKIVGMVIWASMHLTH